MNINQAANILEVSTNISKEELKKKFKRLVMKYHPDRNQGNDTTQKFIEIKNAYEALIEYVILKPIPTVKWKPQHFWASDFNFVNPYGTGTTGTRTGTFTFYTS